MEIDHDIRPYTVLQDVSLAAALDQIDANKSQIVFTVDRSGRLTGVMTDGDFRRWVMAQKTIDTAQPVSLVAAKSVVTGRIDGAPDALANLFSDRVRLLPLVDDAGLLRAVARPRKQAIQIGRRKIAADAPVYVIAEIGNNHNGSLERARRLVDAAVAAGADSAKFQMRQLRLIYRNGGDPTGSSEDLGVQYTLDLLNRFSLGNDDLFRIFDHCHARGIEPLCTAWDSESVGLLESYGMNGYKIASPDLTNHDLLRRVMATRRTMLVSTGMSNEEEIREAAQLLQRQSAAFALLHCNSTYPAPFRDINLAYMEQLRAIGRCPVGYSGHERGTNIAIAAVARGAKVIEKHFTLDRSLEGSDHRISLLPDEFRHMVEGIRQTEAAIGIAAPRQVSQGELLNRSNLAKSLIAKRSIAPGEVITDDMLDVKSPGQGMQPNSRGKIIGRRAARAIPAGQFIFPHDFDDSLPAARDYFFDRPWGIPVRYHDWRKLIAQSNPDLVEFHLSYKDLEIDFRDHIDEVLDLDLVVHCPELFAGDHVLDLCATEEDYRLRSVKELQRVIDLARDLKPCFARARKPLVVVNLGGFSEEGHLASAETARRYDSLRRSLDALAVDGVELAPQTMPPFPWHFGGQRFHNVLVDPEPTARLCEERQLRLCLDISHAKLACRHSGVALTEYVAALAPHVAHLHIADACGVDREGLQIAEGEIDFAALARLLQRVVPKASFIPEIWQGHANNGQGFWAALERLEPLFLAASAGRPEPVRSDARRGRAG